MDFAKVREWSESFGVVQDYFRSSQVEDKKAENKDGLGGQEMAQNIKNISEVLERAKENEGDDIFLACLTKQELESPVSTPRTSVALGGGE